MKKIIVSLALCISMLFATACTDNPGGDTKYIYLDDYSILVDEMHGLSPSGNADLSNVKYTAEGDNILIIGNGVYGLKAGTTTDVTATAEGVSYTFKVSVTGSNIEAQKLNGAIFDGFNTEPVPALGGGKRGDFVMGADISSIAEVIKSGGKFYNGEGARESVFSQLKNAGVNYIRLRLWNDPKGFDGKPYGGGNNDIEKAKEIAPVAKALGMKFLLDFHYSDFWADPGKQIIPKAWKDFTTAAQVESAIETFTYDSMTALAEVGAMPDMVQIGNEITPGLITQSFSDYNNITNDSLRAPLASAIRGAAGTANEILYLNAGIRAARRANPAVEVMIHIDKGANNNASRSFYQFLADNNVDYDIIGLSYYSFYHGAIANFSANINDLKTRFGKKIIVAETSYAFTSASHHYNSSIFTGANGNKAWAVTPAGQADCVRDIINELANLQDNAGYGVFYWEPAWLPVQGAGWAGAGTLGTWADQALFSYDGVALPSLSVFKNVRG